MNEKKDHFLSPEALALANKLVLKVPPLPYVKDLQDVPWFISDFDQKLAERHRQKLLLLPNLKECSGIGIFSDYSEGPACTAYTFLVCDMDWVFPFLKTFGEIKERFGLNSPKKKEIAYTDRDYGPLRAALPDLLRQANILNGLLFTLVVDKKLISAFGKNSKANLYQLQKELQVLGSANWKPVVAERMFRILHFIGYLFGLLSGENQKVFWMTDHDSIVANDQQTETVGRFFSNTIRSYARGRTIKHIGFAKSFNAVEPHMDLNAMTEISDLAAGVVQFIYSHLPDLNAPVTNGTRSLLEFMGYQGVGLKKLTYLIKSAGGDAVTTGFIDISLKEFPADASYIPLFF